MSELFSGRCVETVGGPKEIVLSRAPDDPRAACFAALLLEDDDEVDTVLLRQAAKQGLAFAQAKLPWKTEGKEKLRFAESVADQVETWESR
jgi:hypothetical protein